MNKLKYIAILFVFTLFSGCEEEEENLWKILVLEGDPISFQFQDKNGLDLLNKSTPHAYNLDSISAAWIEPGLSPHFYSDISIEQNNSKQFVLNTHAYYEDTLLLQLSEQDVDTITYQSVIWEYIKNQEGVDKTIVQSLEYNGELVWEYGDDWPVVIVK